ncbi:hypothetical protein [Paenibacillus agricola]|uniref:hypothetical protein n=1 Tax=Paenibacillus agricola TaxID=2716264 RepID=UPI001A9E4DE7|nr:hypothetical protein [Paenibacillus agricola]
MISRIIGEVMEMEQKLQRCMGQKVEIMYIDRHGNITQRLIEARSIKNNYVCAYCFTQKGLRVFRLEQILAAMPMQQQCVV